MCLHTDFASTERVGQGEVGGVTRRVLWTWQLLGLAVKGPWLALGGRILALATWTGLEKAALTLQALISGWEGCFGSEQVFANLEC